MLILPYRAALPTAKQVATVQELSGNRLVLGVGIGWMEAEFRALGVDRHARGRISDETLACSIAFRSIYSRYFPMQLLQTALSGKCTPGGRQRDMSAT